MANFPIFQHRQCQAYFSSKNHNFSVDFFALGVILFELIFCKRPYNGKNKKEIKIDILSKNIKINKNDIPFSWNFSVCDLVNGLLERKQDKRLGFKGIFEIFEVFIIVL